MNKRAMIENEQGDNQFLKEISSNHKFVWFRYGVIGISIVILIGPLTALGTYIGLQILSFLPPLPNSYEEITDTDSGSIELLDKAKQEIQQQKSQISSQKSLRLIWYLRCKGTTDDDDDCPSKEVIHQAQQITNQIDELRRQRDALKQ